MIVRHYNRANGNRKRVRIHPDLELEQRLSATPPTPSEPSLRGIGIVNARTVSKASKQKYVPRNTAYIARNGARIATVEAPYLELMRDVGTPRKRRTPNTNVQRTERGRVNTQTQRDIALMSKLIGTIHNPNDM